MKVFYRSEQTARDNDSFSPSAGKPELVVNRWRLIDPAVELASFRPLARAELALAHDRRYIDAVLDCRRPNGFGNRSPSVAATLPYTAGSMYAAAQHAINTRGVAASPTSGFHHAGYADGGAFCTFNGLMVAAQKLHKDHAVGRVGILDLDQHYGDGTDDIIGRLGLDYVVHYTFGSDRICRYDAGRWLKELPSILEHFQRCHVVLYQAGADPHVDDPLGGVLTTKQMRERDRCVFATLKALGVPVAWNLAGGYQTPIDNVLDLHDNMLRACLACYARPVRRRTAKSIN